MPQGSVYAPGEKPNAVAEKPNEIGEPLNLRCYNMKQRFGVDLLYSTQRYVQGLKDSMVFDRNGVAVPNPLYSTLDANGTVCATSGLPTTRLASRSAISNSRIHTSSRVSSGLKQ